MHSLRSRYILSHILPIIIVAPLVMAVLLYLLEAQVFLQDLSADLGQRAILIAQATTDSAEIWNDTAAAERYLTVVASSLTGEIAFLDENGTVLAATPGFDSQPIDMTLFPELQGGEMSVTIRYTLDEQSAEILQPVYDINQQLTGVIRITENLYTASSNVARLRTIIFGALLIEVVVGCAIGLYLANRMTGYIRNVTRTVTDIAGGEDVGDISAEGAREIRDLYAAVNTLAHDLQASEATRRHLLANLVHELGRPLGAIRAAVDALRSGAADDPVLRDELLLGVEQHIIQMEPLLDDLSHLHGQILGPPALNRQPTDLSDWLPSFLLPWRAAALEKGVSWSAEIDPQLPIVDIDAARIGQAIGNLISNAIKYTAAGGSVAVSAQHDKAELRITVADTGPGISQAEQARIFEPFFRSREQTRFPQGMGLGLSIAKDLTEAHGGRLELQSESGQGSTFTMVLPVEERMKDEGGN
jgi:signal transduction histidine kinase